MPATESRSFISPKLQDVVASPERTESSLASEMEYKVKVQEAWQRFIDHTLIEWGRNPGQLEDEGIDPPSKETIQRAIHLAQDCKKQGLPPPDSVVPDPNGGIVFERRKKSLSEVLHLWEDGSVEYQRFMGHRLVERRAIQISSD